MTTDEFISANQKKLDLIIKNNKPLQIAVSSIMALQSKRIFIDGQNADNAPIGTYKTPPAKGIYISGAKDKTPKQFTKKGKPDTGRKMSSAKRKTGWFPSYLAYKKAIGRNLTVDTVDLLLWGSLSQNWANSTKLSAATPTKINAHKYVVQIKEHNYNKIKKKYLRAFDLSKDEKEKFYKVLNIELIKALA